MGISLLKMKKGKIGVVRTRNLEYCPGTVGPPGGILLAARQ